MSLNTIYPLISLTPQTNRNVLAFLRLVIVCLIAGAAVSSRLFAVIRHESIIHEFDPWFNLSVCPPHPQLFLYWAAYPINLYI
jgi:dolichyl-diphosphooligosaccharide--protein glycosyltransferase